MYNAIYYHEMYLLLPQEFQNYDAFIHDLRLRNLPAQYPMIVLLENHRIPSYSVQKGMSMAPYFLSGYHDEPSMVTIENPEDVYPVSVKIMDQATYNAALREVINQVCPGCLRFKPLTNRVQSLNGHFEEMTLDGVCVCRQNSKPAPRRFRNHLFSFGGFFVKFRYAEIDAEEMRYKIKRWFYLSCPEANLSEEDSQKILILHTKKNDFLAPLLVEALSRYIDKIYGGSYHIHGVEKLNCTEDLLMGLLAEENAEAYRKACKKYGISLGRLTCDEAGEEKVWASLKPLIDHFWLFPLVRDKGSVWFLIADTAETLKELRYRSPLLKTYHTSIDIYDQYRNARYEIAFEMNRTPI